MLASASQIGENRVKSCRIIDFLRFFELNEFVGWGTNIMEQPAKDERRDIARLLFKALCTRFPDRYVILIESPGAPIGRPFQLMPDSTESSAPSAAS